MAKYLGMSLFAYTTENLEAGDSWESGTFNEAMAAEICGTVFADKGGTLLISQSADGENWDATKSVTYVAQTTPGFDCHIWAPYVKVSFTNNDPADPTTVCRVFVYAKYTAGDPL